MALATKEPDNDQKYNPAAWNESTGSRLSTAEQSALSDIESNFDKSADSTAENANIDKARAGESRGANFALTDDDSPKKGKINEARDNAGNKKDKLALNLMKKKGPLALIGLILGGGGGVFAALLSPGLALVQLTESLSEDMNDLVSALDERSQHIFRAQMKKQTTGFCSKKVTVRCNYRTMSKRQVAKFARHGISIFPEDNRRALPGGRFKVEAFTFIDTDGTPRTVTAENFRNEYLRNPHFRALMNRAYSPRWMSIRSPTSMGVFKKFRASLTRSINGRNKAEMADRMDENVRKGVSDFGGKRVVVEMRDMGDGEGERKVYVDPDRDEVLLRPDGNPIDPDAAEREMNNLRRAASGGINSKLSMSLRGANLATGSAEMYCAVTTAIRLASMAARNIQYAQFLRYAVMFHNTTSAIHLGTATPEAVEFMGDILTSKDMREMVLSEKSLSPFAEETSDGKMILEQMTTEDPDSLSVDPQPNPHYGKDAQDSTALKASMHGGGGTVDALEASMAFGGGMGNTMERLIHSAIPSMLQVSEQSCSFVQNPIVQGAGLLLSVGALVITGGWSAVGQGAIAIGMTVVSMFVMHMIQNKIASIINGEAVNSETVGPAAGAALFGGSGAMFGSTASANGLTPISTIAEMKSNRRFAQEEQQRYAEVARLEANDTPFDIYNQYSFLGSIAWNLAPVARQSSDTVASMALSPLKFLSAMPRWTMPKALAAPEMSENRFKQCGDMIGNSSKGGDPGEFSTYEIYKESYLNVEAVDMMCNLRFGLSEAQRNADPEKVAQWMIDSCQVDATSGNINLTGECATGCAPEAGGENCYRGTTPEQAMALLNAGPDQIASAMRYDDSDIDTPIASSHATPVDQTAHRGQLPNEINNSFTYNEKSTKPISQQVTEDVRTYAHFMRYCRYGPEDGRTVNFGDPDIELDEEGNPIEGSILTGLPFGLGNEDKKYSSIGRECFTSNNCDPQQPDPNSAGSTGSIALDMCRPPQHDMYTVYTLDRAILEGVEMEEDTAGESQSGGASTGTYMWPMEGKGTAITSCFAPRWGSFHGALDIAAGGTPDILAADGGEVVMVRNGDGSPGLTQFGESVVIKHADGYYTRYSHMTSGSIVVKEGDKVDKGEVLGKQGNTGFSTNPHLDFGISKNMPPLNENSENPMNFLDMPADVINQAGCSPD